jgi:hypothetical protein
LIDADAFNDGAVADLKHFGATSNAGDRLMSDAGTFVLAETALDMHCWGENPVVTAKLQLNGQDRFSEREGSYFDVVQPFQHHTRAPDALVSTYTHSLFALKNTNHQEHATSHVLTTLSYNLYFHSTLFWYKHCQSTCLCRQLQRPSCHEWYGWCCLQQLSARSSIR